MTEEQRQAAIEALSRLFAELLADEDFMAFVQQRHRAAHQRPVAEGTMPRRGLPSGDESS